MGRSLAAQQVCWGAISSKARATSRILAPESAAQRTTLSKSAGVQPNRVGRSLMSWVANTSHPRAAQFRSMIFPDQFRAVPAHFQEERLDVVQVPNAPCTRECRRESDVFHSYSCFGWSSFVLFKPLKEILPSTCGNEGSWVLPTPRCEVSPAVVKTPKVITIPAITPAARRDVPAFVASELGHDTTHLCRCQHVHTLELLRN
jgi:hypothetical protein